MEYNKSRKLEHPTDINELLFQMENQKGRRDAKGQNIFYLYF